MKIYEIVIDQFINGVISYLGQGGFLKNVGKLVGATAIAQIVLIFASLILTRLYTPEDFGVLAIFTSLFSQILVLASLRYEWAVPLPKDEETAIDLSLLCLVLTVSFAPIIALGVLLGGHQIARWTNTPMLEGFLWWLPIVFIVGGWYQSLSYWSLRKKAFGVLASTKLTQSLWVTGSQVSLGLCTTGAFGLLVGSVLNQVVGTGKLASFFWRDCRAELKQYSLARLLSAGRKYSRFALLTLGACFIESASAVAPAMLLALFYDAQVVGLFALAQRVTGIPITLIGNSVSQVFLAHASEFIREDPQELKRLFSRTSLFLFIISLPISVGLLISPWAFQLLFGAAWKESGIMTQCMIPMFVGSITIGPLTLLDWLNRQDWLITFHGIRLVLFGLGFWLSHVYHFSSIMAIAVFSIISVITYGLLLILNFYSIHLLISNRSNPSL
jgi:O-antigen/teichoic acid export membrane protein